MYGFLTFFISLCLALVSYVVLSPLHVWFVLISSIVFLYFVISVFVYFLLYFFRLVTYVCYVFVISLFLPRFVYLFVCLSL